MTETQPQKSIVTGLKLLLQGNPKAVNFFDDSDAGFRASFRAAFYVYPAAFLPALSLYRQAEDQPGFSTFLVGHILTFTVAWTIWPFMMIRMSRMYGRFAHYFRYVVVYNWLRFFQRMIALPFLMLVLAFPETATPIFVPIGFALVVAFLFYEWFTTKTCLQVSGGTATTLVVLNMVVQFFVGLLSAFFV